VEQPTGKTPVTRWKLKSRNNFQPLKQELSLMFHH
jgi:hypothetical protein